MSRNLKAFYTVAELARALDVSRWTARRWLRSHCIPYDRFGSGRGRLVVLLADLRTYAPRYFASMRDRLERP